MRKNLLWIGIITILAISCNGKGSNSGIFKISETEDAGVKDVLGFFGGKCEYSVGNSFSTEEKEKKFFELRLTESEGAAQFAEKPAFPASNMAYRFYRNLNAEERKEYTHIRPVIVFADGQEEAFEFSTWELEAVDKRMIFMDKVVNIIREKRFDDLKPFLNDSTLVRYDKDAFVESLKVADPQFGNVTEEGFRFFGYKMKALDHKGHDVLRISGAILRDVKANAFSLVLDPYSEKEEILLMNYEM